MIHLREDVKTISKIFQFFMDEIGVKLDAHKLKKFIDLEFIIIEKIVAKLNKLHPLYLDFYGDMMENEINLAKISKNDEILHIGCGSTPITSMLIAKKTGAQVTGIDNNSRSAKQALYYISKFKLLDKVKIKHAEGDKFPVKKFDLIIISQGINPCNVILEYVAQSIRYDARVIFRTSSSISGELNQNDMFLKDIFKVGKIMHHKKNGLLISILLNKK